MFIMSFEHWRTIMKSKNALAVLKTYKVAKSGIEVNDALSGQI